MLLEKWLMPDYLLSSFREVTPGVARQLGIRALLCDIDNTLVTYDDPVPTDEVTAWAKALGEDGVTVAFVSNNEESRVRIFAEPLGLLGFPDSGKPSARGIRAALDAIGVPAEEAAFLGDQLLTDAAAAHRAGLPALIVPPIKDKTNLFFRTKRYIEKPYMRAFRRRHPEKIGFASLREGQDG